MCARDIKDLLLHLVTQHGLSDVDQLERELAKRLVDKERRNEFKDYVEGLKQKVKEGKLTWNEYRKLITEWRDSRRASC